MFLVALLIIPRLYSASFIQSDFFSNNILHILVLIYIYSFKYVICMRLLHILVLPSEIISHPKPPNEKWIDILLPYLKLIRKMWVSNWIKITAPSGSITSSILIGICTRATSCWPFTYVCMRRDDTVLFISECFQFLSACDLLWSHRNTTFF